MRKVVCMTRQDRRKRGTRSRQRKEDEEEEIPNEFNSATLRPRQQPRYYKKSCNNKKRKNSNCNSDSNSNNHNTNNNGRLLTAGVSLILSQKV